MAKHGKGGFGWAIRAVPPRGDLCWVGCWGAAGPSPGARRHGSCHTLTVQPWARPCALTFLIAKASRPLAPRNYRHHGANYSLQSTTPSPPEIAPMGQSCSSLAMDAASLQCMSTRRVFTGSQAWHHPFSLPRVHHSAGCTQSHKLVLCANCNSRQRLSGEAGVPTKVGVSSAGTS